MMSIDDLPWVEDATRIECALDVAEPLVDLPSEHPFHERAAHEAIAVLAGERAAELQHEIGAGGGDRLELPHAGLRLEIHDWPYVQAADRRVRVDAGARAVCANHREKTLDVVAKAFRSDRCVLDERQRFGITLHRHRQAERRLAERPDRGL